MQKPLLNPFKRLIKTPTRNEKQRRKTEVAYESKYQKQEKNGRKDK